MATQLSFGSRKSPARQAFELYLRYGIVADPGLQEEKQGYNPYRAEDGRFDFAPGHGTLPPRIDQANMGHGAGQRRTTPMAGGKNIPSADAPRRQVRELLRQRPRPSGLSEDAILAAQASEKALGVPAAITLAQYGLESAWGRRMPPGSNNPFGIKAKPGEPFVRVETWEQDRQGRTYRIKANFRKYRSLTEAFDAHTRLLRRAGYARAQSAQTLDDYADALTGVYATDRKYGSKLKALIRQYGLTDFGSRR